MFIVMVIGIVVVVTADILVLAYVKTLSPASRISLVVIGAIAVVFLIVNFLHTTPLLGVIMAIIATPALFADSIYQFYIKKSKPEKYRKEIL